MTADSQWPLQKAIYDALIADAGVGALVGDRVFDHAIQNVTFPYIQIGEGTARPFDAQELDGMEQTVTIHVWSRKRGKKETKLIMAAIVDALDDAALNVIGHTLVNFRFEFSDVFTDADRRTRHGVQRWRAVTNA